jgi:Zinc finger, C2H2 type
MAEVCADCGGYFASAAELTTHVKTAHGTVHPAESLATNPASETPGYTCGLCGHTFATPKELAAHDLKPHPEARRRPTSSPA